MINITLLWTITYATENKNYLKPNENINKQIDDQNKFDFLFKTHFLFFPLSWQIISNL